MADWRVEQLRLTAFPLKDFRDPDPNWWGKVVGSSPEIKTIQTGVGIREAGPIKNGYSNLVLDVQATRIDWLFAAAMKSGEPIKGFPTFDTVGGAYGACEALLRNWIKETTPLKRMALGTVLVLPVENRQAGYEVLMKLLPAVKLDPKGSSDFTYSINRPRSSANIRDLKINRLSRWAVAQLKGIQIQAAIPGEISVVEGPGDWSAVRVELDVNSAAERVEALPAEQQGALFQELLKLSEEIAIKGEIP